MGSSSPDRRALDQLTVARALEIIRTSEDGQVPSSVNAVLERTLSEIWHRIQTEPATYVMTKDEFTIFNRYRARFNANRLAQQAVARFWNHFQGDLSEIEGRRSS
ncbi:hypothetical protein MMC22_010574 [Lobaria immixta]|nr:hypothetical protein [Lobaria immixta]